MALLFCCVSHLAIAPLTLGRRRADRDGLGLWAEDVKTYVGKHKGNVQGSLPVRCLSLMAPELPANLAEGAIWEPGPSKACDEEIMGQLGPKTDATTYALLLRRCTNAKALFEGECVHQHMTQRGHAGDRFLSNLLIQMYSKCGSVEFARAVFDSIVYRNLYSWNIMIAAYAQNSHAKEALQLYGQMWAEGLQPDKITFICVLDACTSLAALEEGQEIHASIVGTERELDIIVGNALVNMYGKCGSLDDSRTVFGDMSLRNVVSCSAMIRACAQNGHVKEALRVFNQMQIEGIGPNEVTFICVLDACAIMAALQQGREVHATIIAYGWEFDAILGNALINMYGKCRSLDDLRVLSSKMPILDVVSWSVMIQACAQNGDGKEALQLFGQMLAKGIDPDKITFICILDACAEVKALEEGHEIHATMLGTIWESDVVVGTALVDMYGKCGYLDDSRAVFAEMPMRNKVSWNAMVAVCAQNGNAKEAIQLVSQMQSEGIQPNKITFLCILNAVSALALEEVRELHAIVVANGWQWDVVVGTALVNMYGKCERVDDSGAVFAAMTQQDVVSWNAMIGACAQNNRGKEALQLFGQMQAEGINPDQITCICILGACSSMVSLEKGREVHDFVIGNEWELDVIVGNALVNMYGKCGSIGDLWAVFAEMLLRDVVSWNAMITACAQNRYCNDAIQLFGQMQAEGIKPDEITFLCILDVYASVGVLKECCEFHATIAGHGRELDIVMGTALINMYGNSGSVEDSRAVFADMPFQDVVSWSSMIMSCALNGQGREALQLFGQMTLEGIKPNKITFICILDACASVEDGREIHSVIVGNGWESDVIVSTTLIDMYGKCSSMDDSRAVFEEMPLLNAVSWSAMITACAQNGHGKEALRLLGQMQSQGIKPDKISFICCLDACASVIALQEGREAHAAVLGNGWEEDIVVGNALVNMYGKCGSLHDSKAVFVEMRVRNVVSWSAVIAAYAQNGHGKEAVQLFGHMQADCMKPDKVTFISILTACSHSGLVDDGRRYFLSMMRDHGIKPSVEHCVCMIDLLGRHGLLEEAEDLILSMPFEGASVAWLSLLSSCRIHSDLERAVRAACFVIELDPENTSPYSLVTSIYANSTMLLHDEREVRKMMINIGID